MVKIGFFEKQEVIKMNKITENGFISNRTSKIRISAKFFTNAKIKKKTKNAPTSPAALIIGEQKCG